MIQSCGVGILARPIGRQGCLPPQEKQNTFLVGIYLPIVIPISLNNATHLVGARQCRAPTKVFISHTIDGKN